MMSIYVARPCTYVWVCMFIFDRFLDVQLMEVIVIYCRVILQSRASVAQMMSIIHKIGNN